MLDVATSARHYGEPMGRHSLLSIYDSLSDGEFSRTLLAWRAEGMSVPEITWKLRTDKQVFVDPKTVSRWLKSLDTAGDAA